MIRSLDLFISLLGLIVLLPIMVIIFAFTYIFTGPPLFTQTRVGINKTPFTLIKFRTMRPQAASVVSHLSDSSDITKFGRFLRKMKLDELPQLWNVLKGEMSVVGPRPGLPVQSELIKKRSLFGVYSVKPGITGLAQIKCIDMSTPDLLAKLDKEMIETMSVKNYFKYIFLTFLGRGHGDAIKKED